MKPTSMLLCLAVLLLGLFSPAGAQITITYGDVPGVGTTFYHASTTSQVTVDLGSGGANQTWDFSGHTYEYDGESTIADPSATPFAADFPGATHAIVLVEDTVEGWVYQRVMTNAAYVMGYAGSYGAEDVVMVYDPEATAFVFPCSYQTAWTSVAGWVYEPIPGFEVTYRDSTLYTVDGWGTLITPWGSWSVLRVQRHIYTSMIIPPLPPQVFEDYAYAYVTQSGYGTLDVTSSGLEPDPNFTEGTIYITSTTPLTADPLRGPVAERFTVGQNYPNPFNPTTTLPVELSQTGQVSLKIFDETGRLVSSDAYELPMGQHSLPVDGANWATGTYFARVSTSDESQTVKMQLIK